MSLTIFLPMCRPDRVEEMINQVNTLQIPEGWEVDVLVIVDNPRIDLSQFQEIKYKTKVIESGLDPTAEMDIQNRRQKIADIFNLAKNHIPKKTDLVFTLEDDTRIKPNALVDLVSSTRGLERVGFVSGVQVGRWGFRCLGVWKFNDNYTRFESLDPINIGLHPVTACGFYCFLTSRENFMSIYHEPFQNILGPDVNFGIELEKQGLTNYVNFDVVTGHVDKLRAIYPDHTTIVVEYIKENDHWTRIKPDGGAKK